MRAEENAKTMDSMPCIACGRVNPFGANFCGGCGASLPGTGGRASFDAVQVADPLVGRVIADRYRIRAALGRGGMGVVYEVEHVHIGKRMAMKLLHGELARDSNTLKRFRREAEAASRLSHPNTVQVFDFGGSEGLVYLVMELVEGRDLGQIIRERGALDFVRVARICIQVCGSIAEAHREGIVHRDLKPENVMITEGPNGDVAKVLDFGLAKLREGPNSNTVTRQGAIVGTPYYMPPEQIRGEDVDQRGDIYSLGAMMYKAATGLPPFTGEAPISVLTKHLTETPVAPSRRTSRPIPPEVDAIILRCIQKEPRDRYESADALRNALVEWLISVGEPVDASMRASATFASSTLRAKATPAAVVREELDAYERGLRRRGIAARVLIGLTLAGSIAVSVWGFARYREPPVVLTAEIEPNDSPEGANPLPAGVTLHGFLGKRRTTREGDIDIYHLVRNAPTDASVRIHLGPIPNMDLVLEVIRVGEPHPVLHADSAGVGLAEDVPNFPISDDDYALVVRERWVDGQYPTENVSDAYEIRWNEITVGPNDEREVNDTLELAQPQPLAVPRDGFVGWAGDVDVFCIAGTAASATVSLSGVPDVDVMLIARDRVLDTMRTADTGGVGAGESMDLDAIEDGRTCLFISADNEAAHARFANADVPYHLLVAPRSNP